MITRAERKGDGFLLNEGQKCGSPTGRLPTLPFVWAKLDGEIKGFLVEKGTKGFEAPEMHGKHSLRASVHIRAHFSGLCYSSAESFAESGGLKSPLMCLSQARYGIAWGALGAAMACYDAALQYSLSRVQFDKPIASFQITQEKLVYNAD